MAAKVLPSLVLDGHDGAGKSTLSSLLAEHLGGKCVRPFSGSLGDMIAWLYRNKHFELTDSLTRFSITRVSELYSDSALLIFDRHWLSIFTVLPESYYANWFPLPPTLLCWANAETTCRRLTDRGEAIGQIEKHQYYCSKYKELARRFGVPIIDTSETTVEEALELVLTESIVQEFV